ncbi:methyltransferase type 11 [Streptomyces sp. DSM 44915]|uniref:Methyltransferase type 11 n=1 Tax=Streptomyces chisholmiae TaxID=3075540 RepID=A0ABU2K0U6_9ACTN|nr:methyltransferase type 11 [Streptomyces sp. DSM 44915]MDT0270885.1 methyltransferase type 11 [Streptomyces sp. DSM 44915]
MSSPVDQPSPWERLADVVACPVCGAPLATRDRSPRCPAGHSFDFARQGYLSLASGAAPGANADTATMVAARAAFLDAGHYAPLTAELARLAGELAPADGVLLDAGGGTGHQLAGVLGARPGAVGLTLDLSKYALRRAARAHPRMGAASADVWRGLPVRTGAVDLLLNVFAPRNGPEFRRVLAPGGALLVVTPGPGHLAELRVSQGLLSVDPAKDERLRRTLAEHFEQTSVVPLEFPLRLTAEEAGALVAMGPNAHHQPAGGPAAAAPALVSAAFRLSVHRPRAGR